MSYGIGLYLMWGEYGYSAYVDDVARWSEFYSAMFCRLFSKERAEPAMWYLLYGYNVVFPILGDMIFLPILYDWALVRILRRKPECFRHYPEIKKKASERRMESKARIMSKLSRIGSGSYPFLW